MAAQLLAQVLGAGVSSERSTLRTCLHSVRADADVYDRTDRTASGERPTTAVPSSAVMIGRWIKIG